MRVRDDFKPANVPLDILYVWIEMSNRVPAVEDSNYLINKL